MIEADWVAWASVTFTGARHRMVIAVDDTPATETWLAALPELDLPLRGHLVADLRVDAVEQDGSALHATIEILTVEEC